MPIPKLILKATDLGRCCKVSVVIFAHAHTINVLMSKAGLSMLHSGKKLPMSR